MTVEETKLLTEMYESKKKFYYNMIAQNINSPLLRDTFLELNLMANIMAKLGVAI